ncbi:hypothetical protein K437DRAFT_64853, partial [Tilletiaria anomala UBC 951]
EENLDRILEARNEAADHVRGRGAALLARLDRMFFEGSISVKENAMRADLFAALARIDELAIEKILTACAAIVALPDDGERPYACWAQRLLREQPADDPVLLRTIATDAEWQSLALQLHFTLDKFATSNVISARTAPLDMELEAYDAHVGRTWTTLRERKLASTDSKLALSRHDNVFRLKTTPFSSNAASRRSNRRSSAASSPLHSRRPSKADLTAHSTPSS